MATEPFVGEIALVAFDFAPQGWAFCDGQLLPIAQNTALFALLGTTYGGDGQTTFALPDLRGRVAIHAGQGPALTNHLIGGSGGAEKVAMTVTEMPTHSHLPLSFSGAGSTNNPNGAVLARAPQKIYKSGPTNAPMSQQGLSQTGGSQPHNNMQPFLALRYIIALFGIFPSRN